jgi:MFS family permease
MSVGGGLVSSFGVFLPVISEDFGWGRSTVSLALSFGVLAFGLPSPIYARLVARFGPRRNLIWGNALAALGFAALAFFQQVWQMYVLFIIVGLGAGVGGYIPTTTVIVNWFEKKRPLAMGLFAASTGLSSFIFPPLDTALIGTIGWRMTWLVIGGIVLLFAVWLGGVVLVRNRPGDIGLEVDGVPPGPFTGDSLQLARQAGSSSADGPRLKSFTRDPTTWLLAGFVVAYSYVMGTMATHQVAYVQDIGYTPMTAATTVSMSSAANIVGGISLGILAMRLNLKYLGMAAFFSQLIGLVILMNTQRLGLIYVFAMLNGLGSGALFATMPTFVGLHWQGKRYVEVLGILLPFQVVTQAVAAYVGGAIHDATNNYLPAFEVVGALIVIGIICLSLTRVPKRPSQVKA